MMGTEVFVKVYADVYFTEDGVGLYVSTEGDSYTEKIISFKDLMKDFIEMYQIPSNPPTMHDEDRQKVTDLSNALLEAIDYLRKLEHDTKTWNKDRLGY